MMMMMMMEEAAAQPLRMVEAAASTPKNIAAADKSATSSTTTSTTTTAPSAYEPPNAAPTAAAAAAPERRRAVKSALRRRATDLPRCSPSHNYNSGNMTLRRRPRSERRVRGLWTNESPPSSAGRAASASASAFDRLHEDTVVRIFSNLNLLDADMSAQVCLRWKHLLESREHKRSVRHVEATDFLQHVHDRREPSPACSSSSSSSSSCCSCSGSAAARTSQALEARISRYNPDRLTILDIGHRLSSEFCVPNVRRLVELTLTRYADLTDLSLHAMLLLTSSSFSASSNDPDWPHDRGGRVQRLSGAALQTLRLEHCPLLTVSSVRSIALTCPHLRILSLRGCGSIESIGPLRALWKVTARPRALGGAAACPLLPSFPSSGGAKHRASRAAPLPLASLFAATTSVTSDGPPTPAIRSCTTTHLASIFAVPPPPPSPTSVAMIVRDGEEEEDDEVEERTTEGLDREWDANRTTPPSPMAELFAAPLPPRASSSSSPFRSLGTPSTSDRLAALRAPRRCGSLVNLDVSGTGVAPAAVLDALRSANAFSPSREAPIKVHLERLMARGSTCTSRSGADQPWMPDQLEELAALVDVGVLKETDVGGALPTSARYEPPQLPYVERLAYSGVRSH
jgi:hypothetical protein